MADSLKNPVPSDNQATDVPETRSSHEGNHNDTTINVAKVNETVISGLISGLSGEEEPRRSARTHRLTEKARLHKGDELTASFWEGYYDLINVLDQTERTLQKPDISLEGLPDTEADIQDRLRGLQEIVGKHQDILPGEPSKDLGVTLDKITVRTMSTMTRLIKIMRREENNDAFLLAARVKRRNETVKSKSSSRSNASSRSSKRREAAAKAAALQAQLEAQLVEHERQEALEQMELEEKTRQLQAQRKMARLRREIEQQKTASKLSIEEARLKAYDEESECSSEATVRSLSRVKSAHGSQDKLPTAAETGMLDPVLEVSKNVKASEALESGRVFSSILDPKAPIFQPMTPTAPCYSQGEPLANLLARTMTLSRLPTPEPQVFTGNPLHYPDWISSFTTLIECSGIPQGERIHYLKKYLGGPAKEALNGFFLLRSGNAFERAKQVLEQRFGDPFVIAEAFRSKLETWPKIAPKDKLGLRRYSDFLQQCSVAAVEIEELRILDDIRENRKMSAKLPDWLGHRWHRLRSKTKKEHKRYPRFEEFVNFVTEESEIMNDPVPPGNENFDSRPGERNSTRPKKGNTSQDSQPHRMTLATSNQAVEETETGCLLCKRPEHRLDECRVFTKKSMDERREFVKRERLCFGCLQRGHMSKHCTDRSLCKTCKKKHPSSLHDNSIQKSQQSTSSAQDKPKNVTCREVSSHTTESLTSMVVPVWVSCKQDPDNEVLTYALLDTMSDITFVLDHVAESLQAPSTPATLRLSTMTSKGQSIKSHRYEELLVRGFQSTTRMPLPPTYARDHIPLDVSHIPTPNTAKEWPHLKEVAEYLAPRQDCPVGLLIGYNCPRALAPRNYVTGSGNQPYPIETELGWSIVGGCQGQISDRFDAFGHAHQVVSKEVKVPVHFSDPSNVSFVIKTHTKEVTTADLLKILERDFIEEDAVTMSQEDMKFLDIISSGIRQTEEGYYEMPLPFKNGSPSLPNNRLAASHLASALLKRFKKDSKYFHHYQTFMKEILERGDAEKVPKEDLQTTTTWYIPHHGVYHPKKPDKVRVVFDCSARYHGVSLNDHLLQGPDLINPLVWGTLSISPRPHRIHL